mmetsp:Transcript_147158/g.382544  ORF Transcript_147158/g.382544 Transcript_147158/m.382544 type:complete len:304 (+) Transcript_147158:120-1031(+)
MAWAIYMPTPLQEDVETRARVLSRISGDCRGIASNALPAVTPGLLGGGSGGASNVIGRVSSLAQEAQGCRQVQQALTEARDDEERMALVEELHGHIRKLSRCPHGNHVIQKCIVVMPPSSLQFIIAEIMDGVKLSSVARHKYGCRIVQSLVEHCLPEQVHDLVSHLLDEFSELIKPGFGRFVLEKLLRHVTGQQQIRLTELIEQSVPDLACHQSGCAILGAALECGDLADRCRLAEFILEASDQIAFLVDTKYGSSILTNLLNLLDGPRCQRLLSLLGANLKLEEVFQRGPSDEPYDDWCSEL